MDDQITRMNATGLAWYCARTKPKHEHIAAANVRMSLGLEVFHPRLRFERVTRRGLVRTIEPLFPCYIFVRNSMGHNLDEIRHTSGISTLVHFGKTIPTVADSVIDELKECFQAEEPVWVDDYISPGTEVRVANGAFVDLQGVVLRYLPSRQRVQLLLDMLGRPTLVELDRTSVVCDKRSMAELLPSLAAA